MANLLRLADRTQTTGVDLLAGPLRLVAGSWQPRTPALPRTPSLRTGAGRGPELVTETLDLAGTGASAALLAALDALQGLIARAARWHAAALDPDSIWLEANADGESPRRALLYGGSLQVLATTGLSPLMTAANAALALRLTLTRHPLWEAVAPATATQIDLAPWGAFTVPGGAVAGSEPARLAELSVRGRAGGGGPLYRLWIGFREPGQGTADFVPVWEAELGTMGAGATVVADATASNNSKVQIAFAADPSLALRAGLTAVQACIGHTSPHYEHLIGRYLVLARCKTSAAPPGWTVRLQLRAGYANDTTATPCEDVYIDHTAWRLIPLGEVTIPPIGYRSLAATPGWIANTQLRLYAELAAGDPAAGTLDVDAVCLVPAGHLATAEGAEVQLVAGDPRPATWRTFEDDTHAAVALRDALPALGLEHGEHDLALPLGRPLIVVAAERQAEHVLTERVDLTLSYYSRWLAYGQAQP